MKIVLATQNQGKISEFKELAKGTQINFIKLKDEELGFPKESGTSFRENAFIKAKFIFKSLQIPVLADDSGLEVDFLEGKPGIKSARYSKGATDEDNINKLLYEMRNVPDDKRGAKFKCCLVLLVDQETEPLVTTGWLEGSISRRKQGRKGFGYDPVFFIPQLGLHLAEIKKQEKNKISHRAKAFHKLTLRLGETGYSFL